MDSNQTLQWSALEYEEKDRSNDWFWALGVIIFAAAITSIIYSNYFFAVLVILGGVLLGFFAIKKPDTVFYELNEKGLKMGTHLYPYETISTFWVRKEIDPKLFIKSSRFFMPIISVPIHPESAEQIREVFVSKNIIEEEMKEPTSEKIIDSLGF
ncbi:MAG: hypothetical protein V4486_00445 [Patescibacteria group bacterium]